MGQLKIIDDAMTEAQVQRSVIEAADLGGWLYYFTHDSRKSPPGFPDLVLLRPPDLLFVELKTTTGRVSRSQTRWNETLLEAGHEAMIVRPGPDLDALVDRLVARRG